MKDLSPEMLELLIKTFTMEEKKKLLLDIFGGRDRVAMVDPLRWWEGSDSRKPVEVDWFKVSDPVREAYKPEWPKEPDSDKFVRFETSTWPKERFLHLSKSLRKSLTEILERPEPWFDPKYPVLISAATASEYHEASRVLHLDYGKAMFIPYHASERNEKLRSYYAVPSENLVGWFTEEEISRLTLGVDGSMGPVTRKGRVARPAIPTGETEVVRPGEIEEVETLSADAIEELESVDLEPTPPPKAEPKVEVTDDLETVDATDVPAKPPKSAKPAKPIKGETPTISVPPSVDGIWGEIDAAGMERDWRHRWIIYGFNKSGKTSVLDATNVLIVNFEDGTTTLADKPVAQRAVQIPVRTREKLEQLYWALKSAKPGPDGKGLMIKTKVGERFIDTIAFDTVTRMLFWVLRQAVLGDKKGEDLTFAIGSKESFYARGPVYEWINNWLVLFRELPLHTAYLCQEREPKADEAVGASIGCPDVPPSIRNVIQGDADVIGHTYITFDDAGEASYRIKFGADPEYVTGDRFKVLPKVVKGTTISKLIAFVEKKKAERTATGE